MPAALGKVVSAHQLARNGTGAFMAESVPCRAGVRQQWGKGLPKVPLGLVGHLGAGVDGAVAYQQVDHQRRWLQVA